MGSRAAKGFRRVVGGVPVVLLGLMLTGCTAADPGAPIQTRAQETTNAVTVPVGGVRLAHLGFRHGPAELITLPSGVRLTQQVSQPNVVTAVFRAPAGEVIGAWLQAQLPTAGFSISSGGPDAVLFTGHGWAGAFTVGDGRSALTLRREPVWG